MGRSGRTAVSERLKGLRADWKLDFVVVNGENASNGAGLSGDHAKLLLEAGADCITLGDHAFDQRDMLQFIEQEPRIIRPVNYAKGAPGRGHRLFTARNGRKVLVAQGREQFDAEGRLINDRYEKTLTALMAALREEVRRQGLAAGTAIDHSA